MEQQILKIIEILFGIGITAVTPYVINALILIQNKLTQELERKNAAIVEEFASKIVAAITQKYANLDNE